MLRNASDFNGYAIAASDGHLGHVSDILFDDATWLVRWLVVDTGHWLPGRKVLLPVSVLGRIDGAGHSFEVRLTMQQVKESPDIDADKPASRLMADGIYKYFGMSPYWDAGFYTGSYGYLSPPVAESGSPGCWDRRDGQASDGDPHLRSVTAVIGYHIHARDGEIGHVVDFVIEDADWRILYLVADTRNWRPGNTVLIPRRPVSKIDWPNRLVSLDLDRQDVKDSPPCDAATMVDRADERDFQKHYGDPRPADQPKAGAGRAG